MPTAWTIFWILTAAVEAALSIHYQHRYFAALGLFCVVMATWNMRRTFWYRHLIAWYAEAL